MLFATTWTLGKLGVQSTISLGPLLVSVNLENHHLVSQLSRKWPLLKYLNNHDHFLTQKFEIFYCFLFPISNHPKWSCMIVRKPWLECHKSSVFDSTDRPSVLTDIAVNLQKRWLYLWPVGKIEITSWKALEYGIFTPVGEVSEIERVSAANKWDFWYKTNECENPVQSAFHAVICLFYTYWDFLFIQL